MVLQDPTHLGKIYKTVLLKMRKKFFFFWCSTSSFHITHPRCTVIVDTDVNASVAAAAVVVVIVDVGNDVTDVVVHADFFSWLFLL